MPPAAKSADALPRPAQSLPIRLSTLAARVAGAVAAGDGQDVTVTGVSAGSATIRAGDLFAALPGQHTHGARYTRQAFERGAVALLTDPHGRELAPAGVPSIVVTDVRASLGPLAAAIYGQPSKRVGVVGVTGTSGKTTTTFLLRAGLQAVGVTSGLIGTVATLIDQDVVDTGFTTPEAPELQALLAVMAERGATVVAMEVSSHALAMGRVEGIDFATAVFTNLSQDHLDFHPDMEAYFNAKARLFDGRAAQAVVATDDDWGARMAKVAGLKAVTVNTVGDPAATWRAIDINVNENGSTRFRAVGPGIDIETGCCVPGRYNVANALLALASLDSLGISPERAAPAIAVATVPGRMERVDAGQPFLAVVDYSHKPAAVEAALRTLRAHTAGRLIIVLGCGGDRDRIKRPVMGQVAARGADVVIITDDNPRSEDPADIRRAMLAAAQALSSDERGEVYEVPGRSEAIMAAVGLARAGDTVLVAGKGHETGQEISGVVYPFDDRVELRRSIEAMR